MIKHSIHTPFYRKCLLLLLTISLVGLSLDMVYHIYPRLQSVRSFSSDKETTAGKVFVQIEETWITNDWLQSKYYWIDLDPKIVSVQINGIEIIDLLHRGSDNIAKTYDLEPFLTKQINVIHVVRNDNGNSKSKFYLYPSIQSPLAVFLMTLILALGIFEWFFVLCWPNTTSFIDLGLFAFGGLIRIVYTVITPYFIKNHDLHGHLVYINYLVDNKTLPDTHYSWESFQPPLYYAISAISSGIAQSWGADYNLVNFILQLESCVIAIAILACCIWISHMIFDQEAKVERILFCLICCVLPSLVFESNQINNDVLFHLISFLLLALMLKLCYFSGLSKWIKIAILLGIGLITKTSTLALIAVATVWLCCFQVISRSQRIIYLVSGFAIIVLLAGWFQIPKWIDSKGNPTFIVGNLNYLNEKGKFTPTIAKLLAFNPLAVIEHPFIQGISEDNHRDIFWEYYFKSAFFGQWFYDNKMIPLARAILMAAIALIPIFLIGCKSSITNNKPLEKLLYTLMICVLAFQLIWIWQAPFTSSEDFRFFNLTIVPFAYFTLKGSQIVSNRIMIASKALVLFVITGCFAFIVFQCVLQSSTVRLQ